MIRGKLRVLMVCTVPTGRSGIPAVIFNLIKGMDKSRLSIGYVSTNQPEEYFVSLLKSYDTKHYIIPRQISHPFRYIKDLAKIAKDYDIIHVHGNSATMVLEMFAAKLAGVKLRCAHSHNTSCAQYNIDRISRQLFYHLCNCRLACGEKAGRWLYRDKNFKIVNNGIETQRYKFDRKTRIEIRTRFGISGNTLVIGHVGNFVEAKNHDFLIKVFSEFVRINHDSKLLLLGKGPGMDNIKEKVESKGIQDHVIFAGSVDDTERYLSAMDLIIMPSIFEGFPLTLVEEQANGLYCIVSDAITREVNLTGNLGFLSLQTPASDWAKVALDILGKDQDRERQSAKAIADISKNGYDIHQIADDLMDYYFCELKRLTNL